MGTDVRTELDCDLVGTPLLRYRGNGLELVELTGGGASGTPPGHGKPRAACISAPRDCLRSANNDFFAEKYVTVIAEVSTPAYKC